MIAARSAAIAAAVIVALGLGIYTGWRVYGPGTGTQLQSGILLHSPRDLAPFTLTDQEGQPYTLAQLQGHWTLLFAGFTNCPDVCPSTLALMQHLQRRLPKVEMLFLSVDPQRDTPYRLKAYTAYFGGVTRGVTGTTEQLEALCANLGIAFVKVPGANEADYTMDHSAALVLLDPMGRVAGYFQPPHRLGTLATDLAEVVGA